MEVNRRDFLRYCGCGLVVPSLLNGCRLTRLARSKPYKNIVFILVDDIGYECFGCYGSKEYSTPNVDKLAENGIRFTNCYAQPLCTPSRVKLMTGMSNIRNYVNFSLLDRKEKTIGQYLHQAGYKTCVAGKWQLYGSEQYGARVRGKGTLPVEAGFDESCLWQVDKLGKRYWAPLLYINGRDKQFGPDKYGPDICTDYLIDFIRRHKDKPFFAYYPMILVHDPFLPTPDSKNRKSINIKQNFKDMVAYMDKLVGKITTALDKYGLRGNTLILFAGDNGTSRKISSKLNGTKITGGKGLMTDAGTLVPLIANLADNVSEGRVCDDLVDFSDFLPTILDYAGISTGGNVKFDGVSFWPQITGRKGNPRKAIFMYFNPRPLRRNAHAHSFARNKRWKLYSNGKLYDILNDVKEQHPIMPGQGNNAAQKARKELQAVLDSMPARGLKIAKP